MNVYFFSLNQVTHEFFNEVAAADQSVVPAGSNCGHCFYFCVSV